MHRSRIPSPARSEGAVLTPRRNRSRRSHSVISQASSKASGRLTGLIKFNKNMDSLELSLMNSRQSVLSDKTEVEEPRRTSWWKKLDAEHCRDVREVLENNDVMESNNILDELDMEVLSQEKKNDTLELPQSSDSESICSIVLPQRKLFTQKENVPLNKFSQLLTTRESMSRTNKTNVLSPDATIKVDTKTLFGQRTKRTKPIFPPGLLNRSNTTIADKTAEMIEVSKNQVRSLFGNKHATKRKNIFAEFVMSESDDEIPEVQPVVFTFKKKTETRESSTVRGVRKSFRTTNNVSTEIEMDDWIMLPSSTMVENQLEAGLTPVKKASISKLSQTQRSKTDFDVEPKHVLHKSSDKLRRPSYFAGKKSINEDKHGSNINQELIIHQADEEADDDENNFTLTYDNYNKPIEEAEENENVSDKPSNINDNSKNKNVNKQNKSQVVTNNYQNDSKVEQQNDSKNEQNEPQVEASDNLNDCEVEQQNYSKDEQNVSQVEASNDQNYSQVEQQNDSEDEQNDSEDKQNDAEDEQNESQVGANNNLNDSEVEQQNNSKDEQNESQVEASNNLNDSEVEQQNDSEDEQNESQVEASNELNDSEVEQQNDSENEQNESQGEASNNLNDSEVEQQNDSENEQNESQVEACNNLNDSEVEQQNDSEDEQNVSQVEASNELNDSEVEQQIDSEDEQNEAQVDASSEPNHSEVEKQNDSEDEQNEGQVEASNELNDSELEQQNDSENENQPNESYVEESDEQEMEVDDVDNGEHTENNLDSENEHERHVIENEKDMSLQAIEQGEEIAETPNTSHDTTGRNRKKNKTEIRSLESALYTKNPQLDSYTVQRDYTSIGKTKSISFVGERLGIADGTKDSSAEGSGWDSHRTTRKTLRHTLGKDFTPRKSLRSLVLEKTSKINNVPKVSHVNSTEYPDCVVQESAILEERDHEASKIMRQKTLESYLQEVKNRNMENRIKIKETVTKNLEASLAAAIPLRAENLAYIFKVPARPRSRKPTKPQTKSKTIERKLNLPPEIIEDMKYKPPKRFRPSNASWLTKRLYTFLETKLEPRYDYRSRVRAEKLAETIYNFTKDIRRHQVAPPDKVHVLKHEMARLDIVRTHFDFYEFFHDFMPREVRTKVVPDMINKIPLPKDGVFTDIM